MADTSIEEQGPLPPDGEAPIFAQTLPTGHLIWIRFLNKLTKKYREPVGYALDRRTGREIFFDGKKTHREAYGYNPDQPGDTPIPFWGDHYILAAKEYDAPWAQLKELVNRHLFLNKHAGSLLPGKLRWAKKGQAKFVCLPYHRHLVNSYEAIWAVTEAVRRVSNKGALVPRRWRPSEEQVISIIKKAHRLSPIVELENPFFRSDEFLQKIITLEGLGLAPHYQPIREKLKSYASEMFEVLIAELMRQHVSPVFLSYKPAFLKGEVDVYARQEAGNRIRVLVGSCKLRVVSADDPVTLSEVQNLTTRIGEAGKHERRLAQQLGVPANSVSVEGAIFTNANKVAEDATIDARSKRIAIYTVTMPKKWLEDPIRHRLKRDDIKPILDVTLSDALLPKQG